MDSSLAIQSQIRNNSMEVSDYLSDLHKWEQSISKKDKSIKQKAGVNKVSAAPVRGSKIESSESINNNEKENVNKKVLKKGDEHTYDKGYKKWENFDVDAALEAVDQPLKKKESAEENFIEKNSITTTIPLSPADFVIPTSALESAKSTKVASAKSKLNLKPRDEIERESGNDYFKKGDFHEAIKCYTRSIALNRSNCVSHSNRAMAYLKTNEYAKAEDDATSALQVEPSHIKSLQRRGTARNALGKHKAALADFNKAVLLNPSNKMLLSDVHKTKELIHTAIRRTPRQLIEIDEINKDCLGPVMMKHLENHNNSDNNIQNKNSIIETSQNVENSQNSLSESSSLNIEEEDNLQVNRNMDQKLENNKEKLKNKVRISKEAAALERAKKAVSFVQSKEKRITPEVPKTSYEFDRILLKMKDVKSRADFLRTVQPSKLATIFKSALETPTFMFIIQAIDEEFLPLEINESLDLLYGLSIIKRFGMLLRLLDKKEIVLLNNLWDKIEIIIQETKGHDESIQSKFDITKKAYV